MNLAFLKLGKRLRNKILLGVFLVALIPFFISAAVAFYLMSRAHTSDVMRIESNLLSEKAVEVRKFVSDSSDQLALVLPNTTRELPGLARFLRPEEFTTNKLEPGRTKKLRDGSAIYYGFQSPPGVTPQAFLDEIVNSTLSINQSFDDLYIADAATNLRLSNKSNYPAYEGQNDVLDYSQLHQYQAAKNGNPYVGDVNFTMRGLAVDIAAPIKNADGGIVGVFGGQLNLTGLAKVFGETSLGNSGYVYLLDDDGNFLYGSAERKFEQGTTINLAGIPFIAGFLGRGDKTAILGRPQYKSFWGENVIAAAIPVSYGGEHPWLIVAEWPVSDANQVLDTLRNQFVLFLVFVFILTILVSIYISNRIAKPISILQIGTERIASGIFDQPVTIKTNDELEDLGSAFNKMMKGLKQLQELKDEFVFIAAHELRTPVAAIKGYLSMIMEGDVGKIDDQAKEFIKKVINANQRLIQLVNDLLQVARSEAGRLTILVAAIGIVEPIKSVLDELKPLADEKAIKLIYDPAGGLPNVLADAGRLKEVMVNLVGNAIKYTIGSGTVTISHEIKDKTLVTRIKDTGVGMSAAAQGRLFEKFYRVQTEKTREITGTGLGLFIVKQIIEKMDGKIWVESEEGSGSIFSFSLPLA